MGQPRSARLAGHAHVVSLALLLAIAQPHCSPAPVSCDDACADTGTATDATTDRSAVTLDAPDATSTPTDGGNDGSMPEFDGPPPTDVVAADLGVRADAIHDAGALDVGTDIGPRPPPPDVTLTGTHQVIAAYYPIFPRWTLPGCSDRLWVGDPVLQQPLLASARNQLYGNSRAEDTDTLRFDFEAMAAAGVTTINPHVFTRNRDPAGTYALEQRIDHAASVTGVRWTPTFEEYTNDPSRLADATIEILSRFGATSRLFRPGNRPTFFWYVEASATVPSTAITAAIDRVHAADRSARIILDTAGTLAQLRENATTGGGGPPAPELVANDSAGTRRVDGFYSWVTIAWALGTNRRAVASAYLSGAATNALQPVLATSPSYNEINWGYNTTNCGIGGNRSGQPHYNTMRDPNEWRANLDDQLASAGANAWLYIQAYDEWGEGTTLAPSTSGCFTFLAGLRERLQSHAWLANGAGYCRPSFPAAYATSICADTPACAPGTDPPVPPPPTVRPHACGGLNPGDSLAPGEVVTSCSLRFHWVHQTDGNVVLYDFRAAPRPLWATSTVGRLTTDFAMQSDGNLVLYAGSQAEWFSGTGGNAGAVVRVQDDGNVVIYAPGNRVVWQSNTVTP